MATVYYADPDDYLAVLAADAETWPHGARLPIPTPSDADPRIPWPNGLGVNIRLPEGQWEVIDCRAVYGSRKGPRHTAVYYPADDPSRPLLLGFGRTPEDAIAHAEVWEEWT